MSRSESLVQTSESSIAVVGLGAVLPQAETPAEFWSNVLAGRSSVRDLPPDRWNPTLYCSDSLAIEDKAITSAAGFIDRAVIDRQAAAGGLSPGTHNRLQITAWAAVRQALEGVRLDRVAPERIAIYLGCMNVDEALAWERFMIDDGGDIAAHVDKYFPDRSAEISDAIARHFSRWSTNPDSLRESLFPTSVLALLREKTGARGETMLIDAACASSLAAIDAGIRALQSHAADVVITGGIESNLAPYTFVLFSRLGVLAKEQCLPFDARSDGMSQGEGAVVFVLQREEDARRQDNRVRARLAGSGASSDGATTSLFAPYAEGQLRAYERAYRNVDRSDVVYVECHGTGTRIGDETELRSLDRFFQRRIPVGSVKALVGHTKGAAGSVSLLKCILALEHGVIPPSTYFAEKIVGDDCQAFLNTEAIPIRKRGPAAMGVSSFGFGGINFHLVVQRATSKNGGRIAGAPSSSDVVMLGEHHEPTLNIRQSPALARFAIPPRNRNQIDEVQLAAIVAVDELARREGIRLRSVDRSRVTVISAGILCLHQACVLAGRVNYFEMEEALADFGPEIVSVAVAHKMKHPAITAASGPGILNNVVAGRIANVFDFTGPTYHVDADLASHAAALQLAQRALRRDGGMVIVVSAQERYVAERSRIERDGVTCTLLASADFALAHALPIAATLEAVDFVSA